MGLLGNGRKETVLGRGREGRTPEPTLDRILAKGEEIPQALPHPKPDNFLPANMDAVEKAVSDLDRLKEISKKLAEGSVQRSRRLEEVGSKVEEVVGATSGLRERIRITEERVLEQANVLDSLKSVPEQLNAFGETLRQHGASLESLSTLPEVVASLRREVDVTERALGDIEGLPQEVKTMQEGLEALRTTVVNLPKGDSRYGDLARKLAALENRPLPQLPDLSKYDKALQALEDLQSGFRTLTQRSQESTVTATELRLGMRSLSDTLKQLEGVKDLLPYLPTLQQLPTYLQRLEAMERAIREGPDYGRILTLEGELREVRAELRETRAESLRRFRDYQSEASQRLLERLSRGDSDLEAAERLLGLETKNPTGASVSTYGNGAKGGAQR